VVCNCRRSRRECDGPTTTGARCTNRRYCSSSFQINLFVIFRDDGDLTTFRPLRLLSARERLNFDEPLLGEARLDYGSAASRHWPSERSGIVFFPQQRGNPCSCRSPHSLARFITVKACVEAGFLTHVCHARPGCRLGRLWVPALKSLESLSGAVTLTRAGAELGVSEFIDDERNLATHQRQQNFLAVEMRVALVLLHLRRWRHRRAHRFSGEWSRQ